MSGPSNHTTLEEVYASLANPEPCSVMTVPPATLPYLGVIHHITGEREEKRQRGNIGDIERPRFLRSRARQFCAAPATPNFWSVGGCRPGTVYIVCDEYNVYCRSTIPGTTHTAVMPYLVKSLRPARPGRWPVASAKKHSWLRVFFLIVN